MDYTLEDIKEISKCSCGALLVDFNDGRSYNMKPKTFRQYFGVKRVPRAQNASHPFGCCDYCVNGYGVEICACGSGEPYQKCKGGFDVCGKPMQVIGGRTKVVGGLFAEAGMVRESESREDEI